MKKSLMVLMLALVFLAPTVLFAESKTCCLKQGGACSCGCEKTGVCECKGDCLKDGKCACAKAAENKKCGCMMNKK